MNNRGIVQLTKAHCYRAIATDPSNSRCSNACSYCYDQRFDPMRRGIQGETAQFNAQTVQRQLRRGSRLMDKLGVDKVVRIGAMSDIIHGSPESMRNYKSLIGVLSEEGYHYMLITKSAPSILEDTELLPLIAETGGILGVTTAYWSDEEAGKFENIIMTPPSLRRELVETALALDINVVLRLNPMHPNFMKEHIQILQWFGEVAGRGGRVIMECLRIIPAWAEKMPQVDFSSYVTYSKGGCYNGYRTPHRVIQDLMFRTLLDIGHTMGLVMTICGDMDAQDRLGDYRGTMDCCHASDVFGLPRPERTWDEE